jgi:hypothetical protein
MPIEDPWLMPPERALEVVAALDVRAEEEEEVELRYELLDDVVLLRPNAASEGTLDKRRPALIKPTIICLNILSPKRLDRKTWDIPDNRQNITRNIQGGQTIFRVHI